MIMNRVFSQTFGVVRAILEKDGKFLLAKEADPTPDQGKWSHPAGWIDVGENPIKAAEREILEESGYDFSAKYILGIYSLVRKDIQRDGQYPHAIKIIFIGVISGSRSRLHSDISETKWFTPDEIYAMDQKTLRDLDIKQMVKDYLSGQKFPLEILKHTVSR